MISIRNVIASAFLLSASFGAFAQEQPPAPRAPKSVVVPAVKENRLPNKLNVAVVRKTASPIVTIQLVITSGASNEPEAKAGLADITASMLTKGTKTRTATEIAEAIEFLGGSINSGAGWNSSFVSVTVTSDKVPQAMAILADVVLNPKFDKDELELLISQSLDGLTYNLKQPSFLANYVAAKYSFGEHPAGGTKASIESITRNDIADFYAMHFRPSASVLIFTGNIDQAAANAMAARSFGNWKNPSGTGGISRGFGRSSEKPPLFHRMLVLDLPKSGQAAVVYANQLRSVNRSDPQFFSASVLNSVFGGGYSSRLNYEIRIRRGLSYGAGSSFAWRSTSANFSARVQTKNESAPEVTELILAELKRMTQTKVSDDEIVPRKSVLTGGFGSNLETTGGLAAAVGDLYSFGIPTSGLNTYVSSVNAVTSEQIRDFAAQFLPGGDVIIVGDYAIFKDDLAERFPETKVEVIKADELDLSKDNLRK